MNNGEESWLEDISNASDKIKKLSLISALLAHKPWKITREHISVCSIL